MGLAKYSLKVLLRLSSDIVEGENRYENKNTKRYSTYLMSKRFDQRFSRPERSTFLLNGCIST
jgi:hypothetical protein